jgi:hypothetical protein
MNSSSAPSSAHTDHVLRPMDMTQILNASIALLLGSPLTVLGAVLLANAPLLLWQLAALAAPGEWSVPPRYRSGQDLYGILGIAARTLTGKSIDASAAIALAVSLGSSLLQSALLTTLIAARYRGRSLSLGDALAATQRAVPRLLAAYALPVAVTLLAGRLYAASDAAAVVAVVLLVVAFPTWIFLTQVVVLEDAAPPVAWRRSIELLRRRIIMLVGTWLMYELVFIVITAVPTFIMGMASALYPPGPRLTMLTIAAGNLAILLIEPLRESCATMLYFEQRRRRREAIS